MKQLTIITKMNGWHEAEMTRVAKEKGYQVVLRRLQSKDVSSKLASELGPVVLWRSSDLELNAERTAMLGYLTGKIVINDSLLRQPAGRFKYFQQHMLQNNPGTASLSIPTFRAANEEELRTYFQDQRLSYPVIAKPDAGARGEGIVLLQSDADLVKIPQIKKYVFQPFIPNNGDWRVLMLGGAPIGAIKRQAKEGAFLHNVSQGGTATQENNPATLRTLYKLAAQAASLFHLTFCGVDVIQDKTTGKFFVLEVNTVPQWEGFQKATGIDVAGKVMDWIVERRRLGKEPLPQTVERYYKNRIESIPSQAFHFSSRWWLWSKDQWAREQLDAMQAAHIGTSKEETKALIKETIANNQEKATNNSQKHRQQSLEQYPELSLYNRLLFKVLMADTVYNKDIRPIVQEEISDKAFFDLFRQLVADPNSIRLLSTHAVNFFYLLRNYFKDDVGKATAVLVDPYELLELLDGYQALVAQKVITKKQSVKLQIYLLTHAIIGYSRFYERKVKGEAFLSCCRMVEELITKNYFMVTLDNKLEFLVCAKLCDYSSPIQGLIEQEAKESVAWNGNYLVDEMNKSNESFSRYTLSLSEHRNVLYLMSQTPHSLSSTIPPSPKATPSKKQTIGRLARVSLPEYGIKRLVARVDSGATRSAIAASNVRVEEDGLHFALMHPGHYLYTGQELVVTDYEESEVRQASRQHKRYVVTLNLTVDGESFAVSCGLAERERMLYPMILGRNFLKGRYKVDTSKQFIRRKPTSKHDTVKEKSV